MNDPHRSAVPWAALAVLVTFVSSTLLEPKAFDLLRPAEKDRAQAHSGSALEIDARLWEDPFTAVRRHEADRIERCNRKEAAARAECRVGPLNGRRSPEALRAHLDRNADGDIDADSLLVVVLVPGNPFVGAEESRRRTRFALLAGLQADGYNADSGEQIGVIQLPLGPAPAAVAALGRGQISALGSGAVGAVPAVADADTEVGPEDVLLVPYELLSSGRDLQEARRLAARAARPAVRHAASAAVPQAPAGVGVGFQRPQEPLGHQGPRRRPYHRVTVVWVDEAALPSPKLDGVARLLHTVVQCDGTECPSLAVIGPSSSDGLNLALEGLRARAEASRMAPGSADSDLTSGYRLLANAHFLLPSATVQELDLPALKRWRASQGDDGQPGLLQRFVTHHMNDILPERRTWAPEQQAVRITRTIADDAGVGHRLAGEVMLRMPRYSKRRIVNVVESDSLYARALHQRMQRSLSSHDHVTRVDVEFFFRGLDGVTVREAAAQAVPTKGSAEANIEWPEARNQLDYLRRMAAELKRSESAINGGPIGAIGIFANDVHDKLLILQALRETFPDKVFFTTDMDARFVHPKTLPFTRNLVVASSLPLKFPADVDVLPDGRVAHALHQTQAGTPPLRDMYQTATYMAARIAACSGAMCARLHGINTQALAVPSLYEIGRNHAVPIDGLEAAAWWRQHPVRSQGWVLVGGLCVLGVALLGWPSTPALRAARGRLFGRAPQGAEAGSPQRAETGWPPLRVTWLLCPAYGLWLGLAAASIQEALSPYSLEGSGVVIWVLVGGALGLLLAPGLRVLSPARRLAGAPDAAGSTQGVSAMVVGLSVLFMVALLAAAAWQVDVSDRRNAEPLLWLQGVSSWPSHFLHLAALLGVLLSLDVFWDRNRRLRDEDAQWLGWSATRLPELSVVAGPLLRCRRWLRWARCSFVLTWALPQAHEVTFGALWQRYQHLCKPSARCLRLVCWYVLTVVAAMLLFWSISENFRPQVPVRGFLHRSVVTVGMLLGLMALPALVVAVADATMVTVRLLLALSRGRTRYPMGTVAQFSLGLGPQVSWAFSQALEANPAQRAPVVVLPPPLPSPSPPPATLEAPRPTEPAVPPDPPGHPHHTLLDDWLDIQVAARQTQAVAPLVMGPFIVLALLVMARSRLFDQWAMTWPIALTVAAYLLWLIGLAVLLKVAAERLRTRALASMQADQRWLAGHGAELNPLKAAFDGLIKSVQEMRTGAFAPITSQPLVASLLLPLGGAGSVQLLDLLLAR